MKWKLKGGHKQETRSGYNFWKPFTSQTKNGVTLTVKDDGSYVLSGTATQTTSFYVNGLNYDAADYTIALFNSTAISNEAFYVQVEHENGLLKQAFLTTNTIKSSTTGKVNALSIVIPADLTLNNFTFKPMLLKGIYTANTMLRFEQYGMMPSTYYPSEIKTVGSNVQLFDKDNVNKLNGVPDVSSITSNTVAKSFYVQAKPNTTYTVSRKIIGSRFVVGTTANLPAVGETIIDRKVNNEGSSITLTTSKNVNYLVVYYLYNSSENEEEILDNIKIEKGSVATPLSAYRTGSAEMDVANENLFNKNNTNNFLNGLGPDNSGKIQAVSTNTSGSNYIVTIIVPCSPNSTYIISRYIEGKTFFVYESSKKDLKIGDNINFLKRNDNTSIINERVITSTNAKYLLVKIYNTYATEQNTYNDLISNVQVIKSSTISQFKEHQSQTAIMPIQQEMLQGDYIEDVEHHEWGKYIFTGKETIENIGKSGDITFFKTSLSNLSDFNYIDDNTVNYMCTHFKAIKVADRFQNNTFFINIEKKVSLCSQEITTIDALKAYLKARYDANDPVVIYYKLANAIDLELTEAQKAVREQKLHTYKNVTNINLSDELASIDVTYKKDLDTILNNLQAQIITNASQEV
jgi:hypothetical protein